MNKNYIDRQGEEAPYPYPYWPDYQVDEGGFTILQRERGAAIYPTRRSYDTPPMGDVSWEQQTLRESETLTILQDFIKLADGSLEDNRQKWLGLAEKYGLLQLCYEHGLPRRPLPPPQPCTR